MHKILPNINKQSRLQQHTLEFNSFPVYCQQSVSKYKYIKSKYAAQVFSIIFCARSRQILYSNKSLT